jgi:hypothetical protein
MHTTVAKTSSNKLAHTLYKRGTRFTEKQQPLFGLPKKLHQFAKGIAVTGCDLYLCQNKPLADDKEAVFSHK